MGKNKGPISAFVYHKSILGQHRGSFAAYIIYRPSRSRTVYVVFPSEAICR